jgi:tRNA-modifying protein YgfZ
MDNSLHTFLQSIGASLDAAGDCTFTAEPNAFDSLAAVNVIVPLSHAGVLEVRGPDAEKFLQGQITCSAAEVTPALSSPGAYCTVKGRVVTSFQLLRPQSELFFLRMRRDLLDIATHTLGKYIVFSKATLTLAEPVLGIGLHGSAVGSVLRELIGQLPAQQYGTVSYSDGLLLQCDDAGLQYEYWGPATAANALWSHCAPRCIAVGSRYWHWLTIRAGSAEICAATTEMFLPHMLNYHLTGAINFKKGCYTGQEIVARTHYRGQVKRHLLRASIIGPVPSAGSDVIDGNGKSVGNVVDSVAINAEAAELLAVVAETASSDPQPILRVGSAELCALTLPYAIP